MTSVPSQPSTVILECLQNPFGWTIGRGGNTVIVPFSNDQFNMFGIYKTDDSQFLIINETALNNNTNIVCLNTDGGSQRTKLIIYGNILLEVRH